VSTATPVPETRDLDGDDAWRTLRSCRKGELFKDAFIRLRVADGFSHARSLAYAAALVFVQAIIAIVGLASASGRGGFSSFVVRTLKAAVPGPGGDLLTQTVVQAHHAGVSHRYAGLAFGLLGTLVTGSTLLGQLERGLNRIYGVEQDRPTVQKYSLALLLTLTSGVLVIVSFALIAFGHTIGDSIHNAAVNHIWGDMRWPGAIVLAAVAMTLLFRWSPRRRQPALSWLAFGSVVATFLWLVVTAGLGVFFSASKSFGQTYGPLAGIVALLLWSLLSAVAVLYGGAVTAQLEAVRAGVREPQDQEKVDHSAPEGDERHRPAPARS
jgi:YihY family inner membrane protein